MSTKDGTERGSSPLTWFVVDRAGATDAAPIHWQEIYMIIVGLVLLLLGVLLPSQILTTIGIVLLLVGAVLAVLGRVGRPFGGRRHYW
jgi:hypothetical protein